jgi:SAM-dependent methyltransferase
MNRPTRADTSGFWDDRYRKEGPIWGHDPSPTARTIAKLLFPGARILEIGCGYGRDLKFYASQGCQVTGVDPAAEGFNLAQTFPDAEVLARITLLTQPIEAVSFPGSQFDFVVSHRTVHLFLVDASLHDLAALTARWLKPGGVLCIGARDTRDLDPSQMRHVGSEVYEYKHRPGHRVRYFNRESFHRFFGQYFDIFHSEQMVEQEAAVNPVPCHLCVMAARRKPGP